MSNSNRHRGKRGSRVEQTSKRKAYQLRELSDKDIADGSEAWEALTDNVIQAFASNDEFESGLAVADEGIQGIMERYGVGITLVAPVIAGISLVEHVRLHHDVLIGLGDGLDMLTPLHSARRRAIASTVAANVIAYTMGFDEALQNALNYLLDQAGSAEWLATITVSTWIAFCWAGYCTGIGVNWCLYSDDVD